MYGECRDIAENICGLFSVLQSRLHAICRFALAQTKVTKQNRKYKRSVDLILHQRAVVKCVVFVQVENAYLISALCDIVNF